MSEKFVPKFVVVDYETAKNGKASTDFHSPNFVVTHSSFSWRDESGEIKNAFCVGEQETANRLKSLAKLKIPLVAHNIQFEIGVTRSRFARIEKDLIWHADTMRLVQNFDNGADKFAFNKVESIDDMLDQVDGQGDNKKPDSLSGLGLDKCVRRLLPKEYHGHKDEAYTWIRQNVRGAKANPGKYLSLLPDDVMKRYNTGDTDNTLRLYEFCVEKFAAEGFDWSVDHQLYMSSVNEIVNAKLMGIPVNRDKLAEYRDKVAEEIDDIERQFRTKFAKEIEQVQNKKVEEKLTTYKTEKGAEAYKVKLANNADLFKKDIEFNIGSNKQLKELFIDILGFDPKFKTSESKDSKARRKLDPSLPEYVPQPSFKSAHLGQYGDGGKILKARRKRLLVLRQCDNLLGISEETGRWHVDLKACGTATGRFAGGGGTGDYKLNVQGLARRDAGLMKCMESEAGHTTVSIDLASGEPTVTSHFSQDPNYMYACLDGVGKKPYYTDDGLLMIDDIYLMTMSKSPMYADKLYHIFHHHKFESGLYFPEQWLKDAEVIKGGVVKEERKVCKIGCLGLGYGMGWKKMVAQMYDQGASLTAKESKKFHAVYWQIFSGVKRLADALALLVTKKGYIVNTFGYRLVPEPHKAFNYKIQSTVSGIMHLFLMKLRACAPYMKFKTCIHDELVVDVPDDKLAEFRQAVKDATDSLNDDLNWTVKIRTGFVTGKNWYEAK